MFDGVNDWVDAGNDTSLNPPSAITVEAWINPYKNGGAGSWDMLVTKWTDGAPNNYFWHWALNAGKLSIFISPEGTTAGSQLAVDSTNMDTNQWTHVAFTADTATN